MISAERLRELLHYDPGTGAFAWRVITSRKIHVGDVAGHPSTQGYLQIGADRKLYQAHRLAWLYMTGEWPRNQIDHINLDKSDNRWCNLREATHRENQANRATLFGFKGASWDKTYHKWRAQISCNNKKRHLGYFETQQEAAVAYAEAAKEFQGEFARPFNSRVNLAPFLSGLRDLGAAPARDFSFGTGGLLASVIAIHEAGHCVVARYLGLSVAGVTTAATADYAGLCFGPDTDPNKVTPTVLREEAERRCNDAMELFPLPGMRRECTASWLVHAQSLVMESVAGFAAEQLGGFDRELESGSTDYAVAKLYARSVVMSDEAVPSFVESCRIDAIKILRDHWLAVEAITLALAEKKTLDGVEIDAIIFAAEGKAAHETELRRREAMVDMLRKVGQVPLIPGIW